MRVLEDWLRERAAAFLATANAMDPSKPGGYEAAARALFLLGVGGKPEDLQWGYVSPSELASMASEPIPVQSVPHRNHWMPIEDVRADDCGGAFESIASVSIEWNGKRYVRRSEYSHFRRAVDELVRRRVERVERTLERREIEAMPRREPPIVGTVYFVQAEPGTLIKIGFSTNLRSRMSSHRTSNPGVRVLATMPGSFEVEGQIHRRFAAHRERGEWFRPAPKLLDFIETIRGAT